jgi:hypothetical protein
MKVKMMFLLVFAFSLSTVLSASAQAQTDVPQVLRVMISDCSYSPETRTQTGFMVQDKSITGIVTALHGVADCAEIMAKDSEGTEYTALEAMMVDIDRDVVLLSSAKLNSAKIDGLVPVANPKFIEDEALQVIGYPVNLDAPLPTRNITSRGLTQLSNLIPG